MQFQLNSPTDTFVDSDKLDLKFTWKNKGPITSQDTPREKEQK